MTDKADELRRAAAAGRSRAPRARPRFLERRAGEGGSSSGLSVRILCSHPSRSGKRRREAAAARAFFADQPTLSQLLRPPPSCACARHYGRPAGSGVPARRAEERAFLGGGWTD
eukprot:310276-Chlamydomonas_euryale.AAC.4